MIVNLRTLLIFILAVFLVVGNIVLFINGIPGDAHGKITSLYDFVIGLVFMADIGIVIFIIGLVAVCVFTDDVELEIGRCYIKLHFNNKVVFEFIISKGDVCDEN